MREEALEARYEPPGELTAIDPAELEELARILAKTTNDSDRILR